jgi:ribosomal protein S18 acetylase RimI-like enzyme
MITIRPLAPDELGRVAEIDPSEHITQIYRLVDGQLEPEAHDWHRPRWDVAQWQELLATWTETLKPDLWLGALAGAEMAGLASLRYELAPGLAQLTLLYVSQPYRRQSVAHRLVEELSLIHI